MKQESLTVAPVFDVKAPWYRPGGPKVGLAETNTEMCLYILAML